MTHLLPSNAALFEQEMSKAMDSLARLGSPADSLRDFKSSPADALLPWLLWEYGLSELLPYLPDPRRAIRDGIRWQRLRGTPAALSTALSWVGAAATVEQEPPGIHFAEFQLDPGLVLDSNQTLANLVAIARLSAPARSRLSRIYHGHDLRRMVLDESRLGEALLSDHSGVFWTDGQTKLSFGRVRKFAHPRQDVTLATARAPVRFAVARLLDRYLLDFATLGEASHTRNEEILHSHLFTLGNAAGVSHSTSSPPRRFCRAMVVLSDSTALGDTHACTPRFTWKEEGQTLSLGGGEGLSNTPHRLIRVEVLERRDVAHSDALAIVLPRLEAGRQRTAAHRVQARADQSLGMMILGESTPSFDRGFLRRLHTRRNDPLPDAAGWRARLYQRAQIVLSESVLGDVDARTPRRALVRLRPVPKLGDFALGDRAEVEWQALTDMQICTSVLIETRPYDFSLADLSQQRLLTCATGSNTATQAHPSHTHLSTASSRWQGQFWTGMRWPASSWQDTREVIGAARSSAPN